MDPVTESDPTPEFRRLAGGYADAADGYELGRPAYPQRAIEWWAARGAFDPGNAVLDLAAGTGKLTRSLPLDTCPVTAVEPSEAMRAVFERVLPGVPVLAGTASAIPVADALFDTVVVAQAFHWFDAGPALDEIARVLRPGGGLGLIWNQDDVDAADWLDDLIATKRHVSHSPIAAGIRAATDIGTHPEFSAADSTEIRWSESTTTERICADVASRSYVRALDDDDRDAVVDQVRRVLADVVDGPDAPIDYPRRTFVYWARRPAG